MRFTEELRVRFAGQLDACFGHGMTLIAAVIALVITTSPRDVAGQIAIRGETIHTVSGAVLERGIVIVEDGKIKVVGPAATTAIPPGFEVVDAKVVTPGFIDAHSCVGMSGFFNQRHDQEQLDRTGPLQPELRALDAYNPFDRLVGWLREHGVTTVQTGHAPRAVISGRSVIVKTRAAPVDQVAIRPAAMITATLGEHARAASDKSPGTRAKAVALLRQKLLDAQAYRRKRKIDDAAKRPPRDLTLESLVEILDGKTRLMVTAHRVRDIATALRLGREFGIHIVLDGAAESYRLTDRLVREKVPVILHPTMARPRDELENASFETAAKLHAAGIRFAIQSGYEGYVPKTRVILFEAAVAVAHGLPRPAALRAITLGPAEILGLDKRLGSIEVGKDADFAFFDGDPFEYTSHVTGVMIDGKMVSRKRR